MNAPLILRVDASLNCVREYVRSGLSNIGFRWKSEQEISESVSAERSCGEREGTEVVGSSETLDVGISYTPHIDPEFEAVFPGYPVEIICELDRLRLGNAGFV